MTTILFENIQKYIIKDLVNIIIKYLAFSGYKEIISTDVPQHPNYCSNLVLSPNRRLVAYASKNIVKLYDLYSNKLLKTIETFHRIDGINFTNNSTLVYVNNDGIITKHNLQNDTDDITMILNTNQDNNKTNISLILLEEDETVENVYINNEFIRTGYYAIVMPTSSTTSSTTRSTSSSENIILSDMCYSIVINNKKYLDSEGHLDAAIVTNFDNKILIIKPIWAPRENFDATRVKNFNKK